MKKVTSIAFALLLSISVFSQTSVDESRNNIKKLYNAATEALKADNNEGAILMFDSIISYYHQLPEKDQETFSSFLGSVYYDNACCYSLLNNKGKALDNFAKAIEHKWNNYSHALKDTDLDNIRNEARFKELMLELKKIGDFLQILKDAPNYDSQLPDKEVKFTYLEASDPNLANIRSYFNLDSIAGSGDEISQIKNLMTWVHNRVRHDGSSYNPKSKNAIDLVKICDAEGRGINCRMMATMLNECYLAMGFKSRFITCMPKEYINDCHVINSVYSNTLGKWIWMDPTFNAYVSDENGNLLSIAQVREYLRSDKPLLLNEDANWNNKEKQTKEYYLDSYMAKNLYWLEVPLHSGYNVETDKTTGGYIGLCPVGYQFDASRNSYITTNDKLFWEE